MEKRRVALAVRGLAVAFFILESIGILFVAFVISLAMDLHDFDGPPTPERSRLFLMLATCAGFLALVGAAVEATGLLDRRHVAPRLAVIAAAFAVNVYGVVKGTLWSVRSIGFSCALGCVVLALLATKAFRSRPRLALLADA